MPRSFIYVLALIIVGLTAGCSTKPLKPSQAAEPAKPAIPAEVLSSGERTIVIQSDNEASATSLADKECMKRGEHAQLSIKPSTLKYVFDCIK